MVDETKSSNVVGYGPHFPDLNIMTVQKQVSEFHIMSIELDLKPRDVIHWYQSATSKFRTKNLHYHFLSKTNFHNNIDFYLHTTSKTGDFQNLERKVS